MDDFKIPENTKKDQRPIFSEYGPRQTCLMSNSTLEIVVGKSNDHWLERYRQFPRAILRLDLSLSHVQRSQKKKNNRKEKKHYEKKTRTKTQFHVGKHFFFLGNRVSPKIKPNKNRQKWRRKDLSGTASNIWNGTIWLVDFRYWPSELMNSLR